MSETIVKRPTVLLVNESYIFQKVVEKVLGKEYKVIVANNFSEALTRFPQEKIDLGVFDVCDFESETEDICQTWRSLPQFQNLPIIFLTSLFNRVPKKEDSTVSLALPLEFSQLHCLIKKLLSEKNKTEGKYLEKVEKNYQIINVTYPHNIFILFALVLGVH
jgi:response regulator RpfG family c-di-GMP phosphodiesterase